MAIRPPSGWGLDTHLIRHRHRVRMTPAQMLRQTVPPAQPPPAPPGSPPQGDYILRVDSLPANEGHKAKRTTVEPWILEQFDNGACPTCGEHLIHLYCPTFGADKHFYSCEADKTHRWTLIE